MKPGELAKQPDGMWFVGCPSCGKVSSLSMVKVDPTGPSISVPVACPFCRAKYSVNNGAIAISA